MVAIGRDTKKDHYYHDGMVRVLKNPQYIPSYEEGQVISIGQ